MDVVRVRTCRGSNSIEIQMDWQYEDEKYSSVIAVPLKHFRKADMWFIVRMMLDAAENKSKEKEKKPEMFPDMRRVVYCENCVSCRTDSYGHLYCMNPEGLDYPRCDSYCSHGERRKAND